MKRLYSMKETELRERITDLRSKMEIEKLVSEKIKDFITKKKDIVEKKAEEREKIKEKNLEKLKYENEGISNRREEAAQENAEIQLKLEALTEVNRKQEEEDGEKEAAEKAKI